MITNILSFPQVGAMAFFGRVGNILRQAINKQMRSQLSLTLTPSAFQAIRCMSSATSSKVFVGGLFKLPTNLQ